jgi:hypothetical protein
VRSSVVAAFVCACIVNPQPQHTAGAPGTWTCKQVIEECDSTCQTGMCLNACTNQGDPEAQLLHSRLLECTARNNCYENACVEQLCGMEVNACRTQGVAQAAPPPQQQQQRPPPQQQELAPPPYDDHVPEAPHQTPVAHAPPPPPPPAAKPLAMADVTGEWSFGAKTAIGAIDPKTGARKPGTGAGGVLHLDGDGRFELATAVEKVDGKCKRMTFTYAVGAWKLDGPMLVLSAKQAASAFRDSCKKASNYDRTEDATTERRELHLDGKELSVTDANGDVLRYKK